jgi:hypothetical protein
MAIFAHLMTMLQPLISKSYNSTIWRLQIDSETDIMAIELRNEQDKQTSFASLNLSNGEAYITGLTLPERWLTGIENISSGVMLLHYYKHESGPEHKGIIAINAVTSAELWSNYSVAFDHMSINGPVLFNTSIQPKKLMVADLQSGQTLRAYNAATDKPLPNRIVIPETVAADVISPGTLPEEAYGNMIHYLNHNNYRIISLHAFTKGVLQQHLYILLGDDIVYQDLLNTDIQKLQPEAFVLHKNALVYIKNKTEIKVLNL